MSLYFFLLSLGSHSQQLQYTRSRLTFLFDLLMADTTRFELAYIPETGEWPPVAHVSKCGPTFSSEGTD